MRRFHYFYLASILVVSGPGGAFAKEASAARLVDEAVEDLELAMKKEVREEQVSGLIGLIGELEGTWGLVFSSTSF